LAFHLLLNLPATKIGYLSQQLLHGLPKQLHHLQGGLAAAQANWGNKKNTKPRHGALRNPRLGFTLLNGLTHGAWHLLFALQ
jgi:hypothetical protein